MATTSKKIHAISETGEVPEKNESFEHFVQFYESDEFLLDAVSNFIGRGLGSGEGGIVIATQAHREGLEERLKANGLDLDFARNKGAYLSLDADETLSKFMVDDLPDVQRFTEVIGSLVTRTGKGRAHLRIFGEMVALLWMRGNHAAAIRLEGLWNDLQSSSPPFSLFCAYAMHEFVGEEYSTQFAEICQHHSRVIPGESYTRLSSTDERLLAITLLQQKAKSLEAEIAERRRVEVQLQSLAAIVESSDDAIISKNLDGVITSWNRAAERIYGYSAQEAVGQSVTMLFAPNRQDEFKRIMERICRGERVDPYETTRVRKDGRFLIVSVSVSPIKTSNGIIVGASAIARDITEHKRLEAKFRWLFDSNLIGVFTFDLAGTFLEANNAFLDLLGYTQAELLAGVLQLDLLTPPESHPFNQNGIKALRETGASGTYEREVLHKNGKRIPVLVAATRIEQTETCIGFALDITERKELDKRKDEFISMASHELKTPLTSLKGFLNLLQRHFQGQKEEKGLYYLTRMDAQIDKLSRLINDLLDLSRMQTNKLAYREERFDLEALVQEIRENIQETAPTHHLHLEGEVRSEMSGDRDRIGQVLINLLNNAIKYSPYADKVVIRLKQEDNWAVVSVEDYGIGIATENQHKIFERFFQVCEPEEQTYPGLGIGLYISSEIVRRHGGKIWVESEKGKGSTFHVALPLVKEERKTSLKL
jgi:PAS domain S-box-containing protein